MLGLMQRSITNILKGKIFGVFSRESIGCHNHEELYSR
jgi:hypothetical protein